jgi:hypothetical protein
MARDTKKLFMIAVIILWSCSSFLNIQGTEIKADGSKWFKDEWGKIVITDANGRYYTLYAVTGEVDLNFYELPPAPPQGMFDIRFGSGRIAENLNSAAQTILMSGIEHPIKVKAVNMELRIQDESGKLLNKLLTSGEEITISNSSIMKLKVSGNEVIPVEFSLEQNYPNPFNPTTKIKYSIKQNNLVTITLYDILGSQVKTLVNEEKPAGSYEFEFDGSAIASGVYVYKIKAGTFIDSKKMILMK